MKKILPLLVLFLSSIAYAQSEKEVTSTITKATVFINGAQLERTVKTQVLKGTSLLKLVDLSPYLDKNSIVVKGVDKFKILSVRSESNYMKELASSDKVKALEEQYNVLFREEEDISIEMKVLNEKINFLKKNESVVSAESGITPAHLKEITNFYTSEILAARKKILEYNRKKGVAYKKRMQVQRQLSNLRAKNKLPSSEVIITVASNVNQQISLNISYFVSNAGWSPSYDVRMKDTQSPLELVHKANIWQNTGVTWEKVKITLSNANPFKSGKLKDLKPDYLAYLVPIAYGRRTQKKAQEIMLMDDVDEQEEMEIEMVQEKKMDVAQGIRIRGASSSISQEPLYVVDGVPMKSIKHIPKNKISDIQVVSDASKTAIYGSRASGGVIVVSTKLKTTNSALSKTTNDTKVEFSIETPYSIVSGAKKITVEMKTDRVPADYVYKAIPKLEEEAFLFARIADWEKVGMLSGDMNLYVGNTYVGQSKLNVRAVIDTLDISIGREKNIILKRKRLNDFNSDQLMGSKRKVERAWEITIRNLKNESVEIDLYDQIPVSTEKSIDVEILDISMASKNSVNGELLWKVKLEPKQTSSYLIRYTVKYPKDKKINVD